MGSAVWRLVKCQLYFQSGLCSQAVLTLPKLSAYSRYSEDISCTQGQETKGPCPPDCQPWDQHTTAPEPSDRMVRETGWTQGWLGGVPPSCVLNPRTMSQTPFLWTHLAAMVGLGHQQHATHEVCGGHTLGAFALSGAEVRWRFSSRTLS